MATPIPRRPHVVTAAGAAVGAAESQIDQHAVRQMCRMTRTGAGPWCTERWGSESSAPATASGVDVHRHAGSQGQHDTAAREVVLQLLQTVMALLQAYGRDRARKVISPKIMQGRRKSFPCDAGRRARSRCAHLLNWVGRPARNERDCSGRCERGAEADPRNAQRETWNGRRRSRRLTLEVQRRASSVFVYAARGARRPLRRALLDDHASRITAMRWLMARTTRRSWLMNK